MLALQLRKISVHSSNFPIQTRKNVVDRRLLIRELETLPRPSVTSHIDIGTQHHLVHPGLSIPREHRVVQFIRTALTTNIIIEPEHRMIRHYPTLHVVIGSVGISDLVPTSVVYFRAYVHHV